MRMQFYPEARVVIADRSENQVSLTLEEAEDLYFGLGFVLRDYQKVIEDEHAQEAKE